ncbi:MAG: YggS family pyridoxal phosphate-dependent enzyme [Betaproteobacteria bacterium]|nr:MAG: YggS family pyridoxal phosphate-dependent enzyme [Betaproteobacteria bacterium]
MQVRRLVLHHEGEQFCEIHYNPPGCGAKVFFFAGSSHYGNNSGKPASCQSAHSKTHPASRISEARAAGQQAFGENYVQEAIEKMTALPGLEWHLIGPLQSNKTRLAAERFQWVQTVDRAKIARRLSEQRPAELPALNVLIQVNASGEQTKSGVSVSEVADLAEIVASLPRLRLRGLMAIPQPGAPRARYHEVYRAYEKLKAAFEVDTLSVGMSDDLELAIAEGATMVRIGTAIFGQRRKEKSAA